MLRKELFLFLVISFLCALPVFSQPAGRPAVGSPAPQELFSAYVAETFYDIGHNLYTSPDADDSDNAAALVFLNAALQLDKQAKYVLPDVIRLTSRFPREDYAKSMEMDSLYLLTLTAEGFFKKCGYRPIARDSAPAEIQETTEFRNLCPASAVCMVRHLSAE